MTVINRRGIRILWRRSYHKSDDRRQKKGAVKHGNKFFHMFL